MIRKIRSSGEHMDFSLCINPLGMPEGVITALKGNPGEYGGYPDGKYKELTERLAEIYNIPPGAVICGNGACDIIYRAVYAVMPKKAVIFSPTFWVYERALHSVGCEISYIDLREEDGFSVLPEMAELIEDSADMVFLCSPNDPTGRCVSREAMMAVSERCAETGALLVVDEALADFCISDMGYTVNELAERGALIVKSFTKVYAMSGMKLGFGICGNTELMEKMRLAGPHMTVPVPVLTAGCAALEDERFVQRTREYTERERYYLTERLSNLSIKVFPSDTALILVKTTLPLCNMLEPYNIRIRRCGSLRGLDDSFYGIAVKTLDNNRELIRALSWETAAMLRTLWHSRRENNKNSEE